MLAQPPELDSPAAHEADTRLLEADSPAALLAVDSLAALLAVGSLAVHADSPAAVSMAAVVAMAVADADNTVGSI